VNGDDTKHLAGIARGDRASLEAIYRTFKDDLATAAYHLLGDMASAEDVLQDVFVGLARDARRLDAAKSLRGYLVASVLNRARDLLRRRAREPSIVKSLDDRRDASAGPDEQAAIRDDAAVVAAALAKIPEQQREVVVLRIYGQLRFREIASLLEISINTVQSRHRYALDALRGHLVANGAER
jgi:RNA polymerase sigma-70 factor, ECF subfamily